jgi:hypothetical protein
MRKIAIAAAAAAMLGACAATENGSGNGAAARASAPGAKQYCLQSRLATVGNRHNCTWATDKEAACAHTTFTTIDARGYTSPRGSTQCASGHWLVEMSPRG